MDASGVDQATDGSTCVGHNRRVPRDKKASETVMDDLEKLTEPRFVQGFLGEPVPGEPFERYEVYDIESDDTLVFYRVPFRPVEPQ
jgi:hypothetical protein